MTQRILIVEDSPTQAERLRMLLTRAGYAVEVATTGREGIMKADPERIDLVISDVTMPEMDGFEFCRVIKSLEATRRVPIILLTARSSPADIIRGLQCGADNFIPKPYDDEYLLERVRRISEQLEHRLEMEAHLTIGGRRITVTADRQQIMELLFSTFEEMGKNHDELARVNGDLRETKVEADRANQAKSEFLSRMSHELRKVEADRANQAKSEFLLRMSHELRTPLNAVIGFGQLLALDELDTSQREGVEEILKAGRHLLELINEVLDISRIESGTMSISLEPVHLGSVLGDALSLIRPLADEAGVRLSADPSELGDLYVSADQQRLKQVLINLLSNAVKYNRPGGEIDVRCDDLAAERVQITVLDTGQGMSGEQLQRLFDPFDRLGAEGTGVEGTGLGLSLCKGLVEAMGGTISADSRPQVGTTMLVELDRAERPRTDAAARDRAPSQAAGSTGSPNVAGRSSTSRTTSPT